MGVVTGTAMWQTTRAGDAFPWHSSPRSGRLQSASRGRGSAERRVRASSAAGPRCGVHVWPCVAIGWELREGPPSGSGSPRRAEKLFGPEGRALSLPGGSMPLRYSPRARGRDGLRIARGLEPRSPRRRPPPPGPVRPPARARAAPRSTSPGSVADPDGPTRTESLPIPSDPEDRNPGPDPEPARSPSAAMRTTVVCASRRVDRRVNGRHPPVERPRPEAAGRARCVGRPSGSHRSNTRDE